MFKLFLLHSYIPYSIAAATSVSMLRSWHCSPKHHVCPPLHAHATAGFCGTQASTIASLSQRRMATWAVEACFSQPRPWACNQMCLRVRFWENSAGPFFVDELSRLGPEPAISSFGIRSWNNAEDFKCCFKVFVEVLKMLFSCCRRMPAQTRVWVGVVGLW